MQTSQHPQPVPPPSLTVAIPALNEESNIENTVRTVLEASQRAPQLVVHILVVDDGSTDRTGEIARALSERYPNVRVLSNPTNQGLGASIRRAIEHAQTDKFMVVPGDNDIPPGTVELLLRNSYLADIVMCYFLDDELRGRLRFLVSNLFMLIYTTAFDLYVQYINGPAVYPVRQLRDLELRSTRFSIVAEINVKLLRRGATFSEIASFRQMGLHRSRSFSLRSLGESIRVFVRLLADVHLRQRALYSGRPRRIAYVGQAEQRV